jgi:hypothetical protein
MRTNSFAGICGSTAHALNVIMAKAPLLAAGNGATAAEVLAAKTF